MKPSEANEDKPDEKRQSHDKEKECEPKKFSWIDLFGGDSFPNNISPFFIISTGCLTAMGFLGSAGWLADITSHFRVQYVWFLLGLTVLTGIRKRYRWCIAAGLLAVVNLLTFITLYIPPSSPPANNTVPLRVLHFNMSSGNRHYEDVIKYIKKTDPDLFFLMEVTPRMAREINKRLPDRYRLNQSLERADNFGISMYGKIPVHRVEIKYFPPGLAPSIIATVNHGGTTLTLIATHPVPPAGGKHTKWRDHQLRSVASYCKSMDGPQIVVGDFNTTSFSHIYSQFIEISDLRDTRYGFGVQPSWPAFTYLPLFQICLDHAFVSKHIRVTNRTVGPYLGSDHYPVILDLLVPAGASST